MKHKGLIILVFVAVSAMASCGNADNTTPAATTAAPVITTTAAATKAVPVVTTAATTVTTTTTTPETTKSPEQLSKEQSELMTEVFRGEKMTSVKEFLIDEKYAFESDIYMFTEDGESLDHIYNAPSTYDITKVVFSPDGEIALYGVKNRIIPDKIKEIFTDGVVQGFKDKIADKISGRENE